MKLIVNCAVIRVRNVHTYCSLKIKTKNNNKPKSDCESGGCPTYFINPAYFRAPNVGNSVFTLLKIIAPAWNIYLQVREVGGTGLRSARRKRRGAYSAHCITYESNTDSSIKGRSHGKKKKTCCRPFILPVWLRSYSHWHLQRNRTDTVLKMDFMVFMNLFL